MNTFSEHHIFIFLIQVSLLLGLARGLGELFRLWKQPALTAEILVGVLLGPTILGRFTPSWHTALFPADIIQHNMFETVAWIGILFLLLETGLEIDFAAAWRQRSDALRIALADIIIPMAVAFVPFVMLPQHYLANPGQRVLFALFMATGMTISAMPVAARALHDLKLSKTDLGFLIMSALSINDIIGWLLFTLIMGFFIHAGLDLPRVLLIAFSTVAFTILCLTVGRRFSDRVILAIKSRRLPQPGVPLTFICILGAICGAVTQKIGIHALFGFFIAGVMAGSSRALSENARQVISQMVYAIFVPLFFVNIGLKIDFLKSFDIFLVLLVTVIGIGGRFLGAWFGVNLTSLSRTNRLSIAIAHTPGGTMEVVVGLIAMEYGLITEPVFVAIIFGAVVSSVILGPWLGYSIKKRREVSVLEYFTSRGIIADLKNTDKNTVIRELCGLAANQDEMPDADSLYESVIQRENEMGTAMEEGIAVPHARMKFLARPVVVFGRSAAGIEWDSPDGKPAHFIFLILTPYGDDQTQIQILQLIARTLSEEKIRRAIMEAGTDDAIWQTLRRALTPVNILRK